MPTTPVRPTRPGEGREVRLHPAELTGHLRRGHFDAGVVCQRVFTLPDGGPELSACGATPGSRRDRRREAGPRSGQGQPAGYAVGDG